MPRPIASATLASGWCIAVLALIGLPGAATATTKGLNQIVTPDIQPEGQLSLSFQAQSRQIANPYELQGELGLTKWLEAALFQGISPQEQIFGTLVGLVEREPFLLSTGFVNWSTKRQKPQPFLEAGYYTEHDKFIGGPIQVEKRTEVMAGWAHDFNATWRVQLDFQSGADNFSTAGFACNVTERFQFNPAVYVSNDTPHHVYGYVVLTYTVTLWQGR
jgi:hypothetical protein